MDNKTTRYTRTSAYHASRRTALKTLGGLALAPFALSAAAQQIQPIRFGLQNTFTGAAAVVWARKKIYEKRGLKVEAFNFADGRGVRDAMLAGKIDFGTMNLTPFFVGAATGNFTLIAFVLLGGDTVGVDPRLPEAVQKALSEKFSVSLTELVVYPTNFACPRAVLNDPVAGEHFGISDVMSPWSGAVSEDA